MNLEDQVCSLELAKKLKELGEKQESLWWWTNHLQNGVDCWKTDGSVVVETKEISEIHGFGPEDFQFFAAFTVAELGDRIKFYGMPQWNTIDFWDGKTEANARARKLIRLRGKGIPQHNLGGKP